MKTLSVIKFGGSLTKNPAAQNKFLKELAVVAKKENIILVHGGGPEINALLEKFEIKSKFVNGLRYTDAAALEVVELALSGKVNRALTTGLIKNKVNAVGISGKDGASVICKQKKELGCVGEPVKVNKKLIEVLTKAGFLPVIASIAADKAGNILNVNADSLATAIAVAFKAHRLIFLTDVAGVLDKNKKTIKQIKVKNINALINDKTITGGMIPKIKGCASAVKSGVKEVLIIDGVKGILKIQGTIIKK
ncbi:acetylglutamate kinase [Endomicrobium proavitum]|uniref:Acetylglutamate kinase n=1 Tax=Endomicrobium proavitum TaxID=1408281 RepID=A0A0G3WHM9_9BACT|nr:acetylglutamate kinase [Endomicrobium proavitum]AKL98151.1 Acetylglutamate kinase [Endomicrobium proavitum]